MHKIRLNKKNRVKALKILKKLSDESAQDKYGNNMYQDWANHKVTNIVLARHSITQETLDNFIDLD